MFVGLRCAHLVDMTDIQSKSISTSRDVLSVLTFGTVLVPLTVPRQYIPIRVSFLQHLQKPTEKVNLEQTAFILSMSVYTFLDGIIWKAYQVPHLPYEELPPLADYDCTKHLVNRLFLVGALLTSTHALFHPSPTVP